VNGVRYFSGAGSSWAVIQYSSLVSYACTYDLCTITAPFDGTAENPHGKSIDFAGPNYQPLPYTFTIDMGTDETFTHWRVSGSTHYRFGDVHLNAGTSSGSLSKVSGSDTDFTDNRMPDGFAYGAFASPTTARVWQTKITEYTNSNSQARFQCYLTEVQFGVALQLPPPIRPPDPPFPPEDPPPSPSPPPMPPNGPPPQSPAPVDPPAEPSPPPQSPPTPPSPLPSDGAVFELTGTAPRIAFGPLHTPKCELQLDATDPVAPQIISTCPISQHLTQSGRRLRTNGADGDVALTSAADDAAFEALYMELDKLKRDKDQKIATLEAQIDELRRIVDRIAH